MLITSFNLFSFEFNPYILFSFHYIINLNIDIPNENISHFSGSNIPILFISFPEYIYNISGDIYNGVPLAHVLVILFLFNIIPVPKSLNLIIF